MDIVMFLAPFSLGLGLMAVAAFWWSLWAGQYDDPAGDAARILIDDPEDRPLQSPEMHNPETAPAGQSRVAAATPSSATPIHR